MGRVGEEGFAWDLCRGEWEDAKGGSSVAKVKEIGWGSIWDMLVV